MKRIIAFMCMIFLLSSQCFAMKMSHPEYIGKFGRSIVNGQFCFDQAVNLDSYLAVINDNQNSLYIFYEKQPPKILIGGLNKKNTIPFNFGVGTSDLYRIKTDSQNTFFVFRAGMSDWCAYMICGFQKDGTFVKFFDTDQIIKKYYPSNNTLVASYDKKDLLVQGDTITIILHDSMRRINIAKACFKWDEKAQWFGIEILPI